MHNARNIQYECASKSKVNGIQGQSVVAMKAILNANYYEPFAILGQLGITVPFGWLLRTCSWKYLSDYAHF